MLKSQHYCDGLNKLSRTKSLIHTKPPPPDAPIPLPMSALDQSAADRKPQHCSGLLMVVLGDALALGAVLVSAADVPTRAAGVVVAGAVQAASLTAQRSLGAGLPAGAAVVLVVVEADALPSAAGLPSPALVPAAAAVVLVVDEADALAAAARLPGPALHPARPAVVSVGGGGGVGGTGSSDEFENDAKNLQVALNLEFLEAEFFLFSVLGFGLDKVNSSLVGGGPEPRGGQRAKLDSLTADLIAQFGYQEVGHLRAIKETLGKWYFSRPQLDISKKVFATIFDKALGEKLEPPFDVYANPVNYFLGVYIIPYVGLTGYVGAAPNLLTPTFKRRVAGLLGVEAGQDAVTRQYLYERKDDKVEPFDYTVAYFTDKISDLRNKLSHALVDEGLTVPPELSAEAGIVKTSDKLVGNILAGDKNSLSYARTPAQIFSTVYGTGDPSKPGGFYPKGAKGVIAESYLDD